MRIERLTRPLAPEVGRLHRRFLDEGFLASLGERFLGTLYTAMNEDPGSAVFVARADDSPSAVGFIAGTCDVAAMQRSILRRRGLRLAVSVGLRALAPTVIRNVLRSLRYSRSGESEPAGGGTESSAEMLSLAVDPAYRRHKVAAALTQSLESFLRRRGTEVYSLVTDEDNKLSHGFFCSIGFVVHPGPVLNGRPMHRLVKRIADKDQPRSP